MAKAPSVSIRPARRDDVETIVKMLADDALGGPRERPEHPLPAAYFAAFERVARDPNLALVVAEGEGGAVFVIYTPSATFEGQHGLPAGMAERLAPAEALIAGAIASPAAG